MIRLTNDWVNKRFATSAPNRAGGRCPRFNFTMYSVFERDCKQNVCNDAVDAADSTAGLVIDEDQDGIDDVCEDWLAERFAPIVYHGEDETCYPVNVDWWLARTNLSVIDQRGKRKRIVPVPVTQSHLTGQLLLASGQEGLSSEFTRSRVKETTFYLENVAPQFREGQKNEPAAWKTYVHSFANDIGGITIQYWRAYTWNQAKFLVFDFSHGGDWEGVAVHLDSRLKPQKVSFLDHSGINYEGERVQWEGAHPRVWSEEGGHSSHPDARKMKSSRFIIQETWTGGQVIWWDGGLRRGSGGLLNIGEKTNPSNGQDFVKYSGLWGASRKLFLSSGYWGPAFNETDAQCSDGTVAYGPGFNPRAKSPSCTPVFIKAWCDGMNSHLLDLERECHAPCETP